LQIPKTWLFKLEGLIGTFLPFLNFSLIFFLGRFKKSHCINFLGMTRHLRLNHLEIFRQLCFVCHTNLPPVNPFQSVQAGDLNTSSTANQMIILGEKAGQSGEKKAGQFGAEKAGQSGAEKAGQSGAEKAGQSGDEKAGQSGDEGFACSMCDCRFHRSCFPAEGCPVCSR
jgi:hypothetical protein